MSRKIHYCFGKTVYGWECCAIAKYFKNGKWWCKAHLPLTFEIEERKLDDFKRELYSLEEENITLKQKLYCCQCYFQTLLDGCDTPVEQHTLKTLLNMTEV